MRRLGLVQAWGRDPGDQLIGLVLAANQPVVSRALPKRLGLERHDIAMEVFFHLHFLIIALAWQVAEHPLVPSVDDFRPGLVDRDRRAAQSRAIQAQ